MSDVKIPKIYIFRLFQVINGATEYGTDYAIGERNYEETLDKALNFIKRSNQKLNHFEIYEIELSYSQIAASKMLPINIKDSDRLIF